MPEKRNFLVKQNSFSRMNILIHLDNALDYITFMSSSLKKNQENIKEDMNKRVKNIQVVDGLDAEDKSHQLDYLADGFNDRMYEMGEVFPQIQWKTQFIFALSLFEEAMNNICQYSEVHSSLQVTYKDFQGMGIGRCKVYLSKIHNLESVFSKVEWSEIQKYQMVRNILVHANGSLSEQSQQNIKKVKYLCNEMEHFKVKLFNQELSSNSNDFKDGDIHINEIFVIETIQKLRAFLFMLCEQNIMVK